MKRPNTRALVALVVGGLLLGVLPAIAGAAHTPPTPLLKECSDVNGDNNVSVGDIGGVVGKFGTSAGNPNYYPLYNLTVGTGDVDNVSVGDIGAAVGDFGRFVGGAINPCPAVDSQIATATHAILDDPQRDQFLNENSGFLAGRGYVRASTDVPGQGIHYINYTNWDGVFSSTVAPYMPEGLVYNNGKLVAQLTFADGDSVGWGPEPPPPDQVNIDAFCSPVSPNTSCSWSGTEDGFHWHQNLCTAWIGTTHAVAVPGVASSQDCEDLHNSQPWGGAWQWNARVGWMGHLWNHTQVNPNGRLVDCAPDETGQWEAYDCPQ